MCFPGGSVVENLPANAGDIEFDPWVGKIPWRKQWQPTPVFLPAKFHGWRSLLGYSPWGHKTVRHHSSDWTTTTKSVYMSLFLSHFVPPSPIPPAPTSSFSMTASLSLVICSDADRPRICHTERSKSEREKQILYIHVYMESRKVVLMNVFSGLALNKEDGATAKECQWSLEAKKVKEMDYFLGHPEGTQPYPHLDFCPETHFGLWTFRSVS